MAKLELQLREDRALRDAARRLLEADLGLVKSDVDRRGLGERTADRLRDGSLDIADKAMDYARVHPVLVYGGLAAVLLAVFRNPILDLILNLMDDDEDSEGSEREAELGAAEQAEPDEPRDRSRRRRGF